MSPAPPGDLDACRSCGAPIAWVHLEPKLSRTPLDPAPVEDGNVVIISPGHARVLHKGETFEGPRYQVHHRTCPDAAAWRGRGRADRGGAPTGTPSGGTRGPGAASLRPT